MAEDGTPLREGSRPFARFQPSERDVAGMLSLFREQAEVLRQHFESPDLVPQFDLVDLVRLAVARLRVLDDHLEAGQGRAFFGIQLRNPLEVAFRIKEGPHITKRHVPDFLQHLDSAQFGPLGDALRRFCDRRAQRYLLLAGAPLASSRSFCCNRRGWRPGWRSDRANTRRRSASVLASVAMFVHHVFAVGSWTDPEVKNRAGAYTRP